MSHKKGFTLIEIIVVLIIIAILVAVAIPSYVTFMNQGAATAAANNLVTIYNAQKAYYLNNNGNYCVASGGVCNSFSSVNTGLGLNITDSNFTYNCVNYPFGPTGFTCYATNSSDNNFVLTVNGGQSSSPTPIILLGGSGCTIGNMTSCNPSCTDPDNTSYCPS